MKIKFFDINILMLSKGLRSLVFASIFSLFFCSPLTGEGQDQEEVAGASHAFFMARSEGLPDQIMEKSTDHYLEGYIQALVDMHYYEHRVIVLVEKHVVSLYNLPNNALLRNSIVSFVEDIPCVCEVEVKCEISEEVCERRRGYVELPCINGVWFPQQTVLYPPMIADPRQVMYSIAYRSGDEIVGNKCIVVAMGDNFPIYRWYNVFPWCGDLQIGVEAGIWAPFNFEDVPHINGTCCELVNTDYLLGIPLDYSVDRWAFRLRLYHISSHLGDEFLVNNPFRLLGRDNPSLEALEFFTSCQITRFLRLYAGPGVVLHSDETFPMDDFYVEYGAEARFFPTRFCYQRLYGTFFAAVDIQNWQVRDWDFDWTVKAGYEFSKLEGVGRKMRFFASYHDGFSYEGQFFLCETNYWEFGFSWGF